MLKRCIVKNCNNNSRTAADKYFVLIPIDRETRLKWFQAMNIADKTINTTKYFVCEDHFNLEEDAENWMFFKTMGSKLQIKKNIVPHKNIEKITESQIQISQKKQKVANVRQLENSSRKVLLLPKGQTTYFYEPFTTLQISPLHPGNSSQIFSNNQRVDKAVQTDKRDLKDAFTETDS